MRPVLFLLLISIVVFEEILGDDKQDWVDYKIKFNKTFKTKIQEQKRFRIFQKNLKEINAHNKRYEQGLETYEKGITEFSDLTKKQFDRKYGLQTSLKLKTYRTSKNVFKISNEKNTAFDWRDKGAVTPVKKQGVCGACWIFSATGMLESYNFRKTGRLISLSEQNVVDCFSNNSCEGGFPGDALTYIKEHGVSKESDYPYQAKQGTCKNVTSRIKIDFKNFVYLNGTEDAVKTALEKCGPVGASIYASGQLRLYKRGVWYDRKCLEATNHAVLLVGYGTENGTDYWLIKNSWGVHWGESGYIKIVRNKHENYCGLTKEAMCIF